MVKKTFSRDYLMDELGLPYSAVFKEIVDTNRWSIHHRIIFSDKGKFYEAYYSEGATECQDESPWEYDKTVECTEVELKEVVVKKWVPVEEVKG
jgi:hypothetical protein